MNIKWALALGFGLAGGWAARSLSDSPQGAGVKLLEIALKAKDRVARWAAVEGERLDDMLAEARSMAESDVSRPKSKSGHKGQSGNGRRGPRVVRRAEPA